MARIAIVGAGPAGASAGYHLAARGHAVALIDRAAFPRNKTCGDWIPPAAMRELARMGIDSGTFERLATERARVTGSVLAAPDGRTSANRVREPAWCVPRRVFDAILWRHAVAAGCAPERREVRELGRGRGGFFGAFDHVIDARGAHAGDANAVALRGYWTVRRDRLASGDADSVQIHTDARYRRGYGWIFPVHADAETVRFNVGVGLWRADSARGHSVADYFSRFVAEDPTAARLRAAATTTERPVGYHVALARWRNPVAGDGVLRIGDAANLADPLTGDGIANALRSGALVAEAIDAARSAEDAAARWQRRCDESFGAELRTALVLRRLLTSTPGKNLAARLLVGLPSLRTRLHGAIFGETHYRALLARQH
jgi:flavin-dependent dehydrogenase